LKLVSYLAPNLFWFYEAVAAYLGRVLKVETQIVQSELDPLEDPLLQQVRWDIAFICGLPLVRHNRVVDAKLKAIAAPVMQAKRYQNRPVYFSDIIVRNSSQITTFEQLAAQTFCYNDLGSNSGYNLMRHRLIQGKYPKNFFSKTIPSGAHQHSIRLVVEGMADCAAIDSTVLEQQLQDFPKLAARLRVIESIGPCPMPPIAVTPRLGNDAIARLQTALLHPDLQLQTAMERAQLRRYAVVETKDYDAIALYYDTAIEAGYETLG
jgi:phosphonate transport system substrate-binding protein